MAYDLAIIGTGPAGLSAAIYAGRAGCRTLLIEKKSIGGELVNRDEVWSYPGFPEPVSGTELRSKLVSAVEQYDLDLTLETVEGVEMGRPHTVRTGENRYEATAILVATGGTAKRLGLPGEDELVGRGVFYCAKCDGPLFEDETVAIAGGGNGAVIDALFLTKFASDVLLVETEQTLPADDHLREELKDRSNVRVETGARITELVEEDGTLAAIELVDGDGESTRREPADGLYVRIGTEPATGFIEGTVPLTDSGAVVVDETMETEVPGVFAAGDVRAGSPREVGAAVGDGITAFHAMKPYLTGAKPVPSEAAASD